VKRDRGLSQAREDTFERQTCPKNRIKTVGLMIRPVTKGDLPAIVRLLRELWPTESLTADEMAPVLDRYLHDNDYEVFCFEKDTV
jgi:hypothetical protein